MSLVTAREQAHRILRWPRQGAHLSRNELHTHALYSRCWRESRTSFSLNLASVVPTVAVETDQVGRWVAVQRVSLVVWDLTFVASEQHQARQTPATVPADVVAGSATVGI